VLVLIEEFMSRGFVPPRREVVPQVAREQAEQRPVQQRDQGEGHEGDGDGDRDRGHGAARSRCREAIRFFGG